MRRTQNSTRSGSIAFRLVIVRPRKAQIAVEIGVPPSVSGAITKLRPMLAHLMVLRRGTFTMASSSHGPWPAGAMLTAGANIASMVRAEAATTAAAALRPAWPLCSRLR